MEDALDLGLVFGEVKPHRGKAIGERFEILPDSVRRGHLRGTIVDWVRPVLFEFGRIPIPTHEFFIGVGVLAAIALYIYLADRRGRLTEHTMWIVVGALVTGAVFAKISTAWRPRSRHARRV